MISVSEQFNEKISENVRHFFYDGKITTTDGKEYIFTDKDIVKGSGYITAQCSGSEEIEIGSVYAKEMGITLFSDIDRYSLFGAVVEIYFNLKLDNDEVERIKMGVFEVIEANRTLNCIEIKAFDYMLKLDKDYDGKITGGTAYDFLLYISDVTGIGLKQSEEEIKGMPNGNILLGIYTENDTQTYRDLVHYLGQVLGGFFIIDREGLLELKKYSINAVQTVKQKMRFKSSFSDFKSRYSAISSTNIRTKKSEYYALEEDEYLTMNLGVNPLLQFGLAETREEVLKNILADISKIDFIPYDVDFIGNPALDIGDTINFSFLNGDEKKSTITKITYKIGAKHSIRCVGKNPYLGVVKSKSDKNIAGLMNKIESGKIIVHSFTNISPLELSNSFVPLISIEFASTEETDAQFNAQVLLNVLEEYNDEKSIGDSEVQIKYILNDNEITTFMPKENYKKGAHIMSLYYPLSALKSGTYNTFKVLIKNAYGKVKINRNSVIATISGQGLSASKLWDGRVEINEKIEQLTFESKFMLREFIDSYFYQFLKPKKEVIREDFSLLSFGSFMITPFEETLKVNPVIVTETITTKDKNKMTYNNEFVLDDTEFKLNKKYEINSNLLQINEGQVKVLSIDKTKYETIESLEVVIENG